MVFYYEIIPSCDPVELLIVARVSDNHITSINIYVESNYYSVSSEMGLGKLPTTKIIHRKKLEFNISFILNGSVVFYVTPQII